jgi:spore coat protein H
MSSESTGLALVAWVGWSACTASPVGHTKPAGEVVEPEPGVHGPYEALGTLDLPPEREIDPFDPTEVHRLDIRITPTDAQALQDDLRDMLGEPGGPEAGAFPGGGLPPGEIDDLTPCAGWEAGDPCVILSGPFRVGGTCRARGGETRCVPNASPASPEGPGLLPREPLTVPVEVELDGESWTRVGLRYKGNSSLVFLWGVGNRKLPFRLEFDEFEDEWPALEDQHFWGWQEVTFSPNWPDDSQLREAFVSDLLASHGVPVARHTFVRVYVDEGAGPEWRGLYTMIEDLSDDRALERLFGDADGNLYKPEGRAASWAYFDAEAFPQKGGDEDDWSDVQAAITALHADLEPAAWRAGLEAAFDTHGFLRWLALNTVFVNGDTYGHVAHNYYLYATEGAPLVWIPWDNNLAMMEVARTTSVEAEIFHTRVGEGWPLIRRLLDDPVYAEEYETLLREALVGGFEVEAARAHLQELHDRIAPFMPEDPGSTTISSPEAFARSVDDLTAFVARRRARVEEALAAR